ncbi:MAG: hypothetical protein AABY00_00245 [Nanoarchaeota archaeon]
MIKQILEYAPVTSEQPTLVTYASDLLNLSPGTDVKVCHIGTLPVSQQTRDVWTFYEAVGEDKDRVRLLQRVFPREIHMLAANVMRVTTSARGLIFQSGFDHLIYMPDERKVAFPIVDKFLRGFGK